jgi:hypothetical protein
MESIIYIIFALGAVVLSILKGMKEKQGEAPRTTPVPRKPKPDVWVATKENVQKMLSNVPRPHSVVQVAAVQPRQEAVAAVIVDAEPLPIPGPIPEEPKEPQTRPETFELKKLTPLQNAVIYAELLAPPLALRRTMGYAALVRRS